MQQQQDNNENFDLFQNNDCQNLKLSEVIEKQKQEIIKIRNQNHLYPLQFPISGEQTVFQKDDDQNYIENEDQNQDLIDQEECLVELKDKKTYEQQILKYQQAANRDYEEQKHKMQQQNPQDMQSAHYCYQTQFKKQRPVVFDLTQVDQDQLIKKQPELNQQNEKEKGSNQNISKTVHRVSKYYKLLRQQQKVIYGTNYEKIRFTELLNEYPNKKMQIIQQFLSKKQERQYLKEEDKQQSCQKENILFNQEGQQQNINLFSSGNTPYKKLNIFKVNNDNNQNINKINNIQNKEKHNIFQNNLKKQSIFANIPQRYHHNNIFIKQINSEQQQLQENKQKDKIQKNKIDLEYQPADKNFQIDITKIQPTNLNFKQSDNNKAKLQNSKMFEEDLPQFQNINKQNQNKCRKRKKKNFYDESDDNQSESESEIQIYQKQAEDLKNQIQALKNFNKNNINKLSYSNSNSQSQKNSQQNQNFNDEDKKTAQKIKNLPQHLNQLYQRTTQKVDKNYKNYEKQNQFNQNNQQNQQIQINPTQQIKQQKNSQKSSSYIAAESEDSMNSQYLLYNLQKSIRQQKKLDQGHQNININNKKILYSSDSSSSRSIPFNNLYNNNLSSSNNNSLNFNNLQAQYNNNSLNFNNLQAQYNKNKQLNQQNKNTVNNNQNKDIKIYQVELLGNKGQNKHYFPCYLDKQLGIGQFYQGMLENQVQDDDVSTDEETEEYYIKKCFGQLNEAIELKQKEEKIQKRKSLKNPNHKRSISPQLKRDQENNNYNILSQETQLDRTVLKNTQPYNKIRSLSQTAIKNKINNNQNCLLQQSEQSYENSFCI
ncbi:hypothetical protein PPERSA_13022 [Pseudocohnilembus persalinus]|uniref:Uncharacterized protein n=1 Tax=Pseudocohnilembus persalinus TaxID=266149 RepID=A0A0V0R2C3_PSEPJ|nr:hypothetical protein PPERSA_13022 [Pseudocohnilembus persalinus]|eukprot:KRX08541.1 hypothetical protein PPERSA_13022 [Pseudocohnilembus persalinus]